MRSKLIAVGIAAGLGVGSVSGAARVGGGELTQSVVGHRGAYRNSGSQRTRPGKT